ncbi:PDR/VanB family oxidoreductase [Nakamurella endophytica]|uniref:Ferredoxin n=1 Tax=Nakamurella endophytica TaxID=1748367 RepID=A0A917SW97_9ACTN|nr:PDR/VanB family oxidoreductase [Nakamurella endophytica]GGL99075.1 ferredoxin [Nakamurella endophytica]
MTGDDRLTVAAVEQTTVDVRSYVLTSHRPLRPYEPGSHLVVGLDGVRTCYSLTDDGTAPDAYRISVRRTGRGGLSDALHDTVRVGGQLSVSGPRSAFPPVPHARHHLFVAAGIGITPILSHLGAARRWGRSCSVVYGYRSGAAAHLELVRRLAGADLVEAPGRTALASAVAEAVERQPVGTHLYACGPRAVLDLVTDRCAAAGWPPERVHVEHFTAPDLDAGAPFEVLVRSSGRRLPVPAGVSLLEVLERDGVAVDHLCRTGVCGRCRIGVLAGTPEHRDLVLPAALRDAADRMYPCVSRAGTAELELDL